MDSILLSNSERVIDGLGALYEAATGFSPSTQDNVSVEQALLIVALAQHAPDRQDWFPRGKWATIQAIQDRIDKQLAEPIARLNAMKGKP